MKRLRLQWRAGSLGLLCATFLAVLASRAGSQRDLPEGKGKDVVIAVCTECHGLLQITSSRLSQPGWEGVVTTMISNGAPLSDEEKETVVEYLAKNFGEEKTEENAQVGEAKEEKAKEGEAKEGGANSEKVNVNKAAAKDLVSAFGLSEKEAESIVQYREKNGDFGNWEDLKKVPDLDSKKIEAKKDQLAF